MKRTTLKKLVLLTTVAGVITNIVVNLLVSYDRAESLLWLYILFPIAFLGVGYGFKFAGVEGSAGPAAATTSPCMAFILLYVILDKLNVNEEFLWQLACRYPIFAIFVSIIIFEYCLYKNF